MNRGPCDSRVPHDHHPYNRGWETGVAREPGSEAESATLRERIITREPEGWFGLDHLLNEMEHLHVTMPALDGVHLVLDTERLTSGSITESIRAARADELAAQSSPQT